MKTVILAGGLGTRLSEMTSMIPKPMIEIGSLPMVHHIMEHYFSFGYKEFVLALGYKAEVIKKYFADFSLRHSDCSIDLSTGEVEFHQKTIPSWKVHLINTGLTTETGGRIKRLSKWLSKETFFLTYGDGLSDIDLSSLLAFHKRHGKLATVTAVRPTARFGHLALKENAVINFSEKAQNMEGWISGGFFVLEPEVLSYIENDQTIWEKGPLEKLALEGELMAYPHEGFWKSMDTLKDQRDLENLCFRADIPWKRKF